jgi:MIP family channel proteins
MIVKDIFRRCVAEFIGTFALVFAGTGAIIFNEITDGSITPVGVGLTFGLIVSVMIFSIGHISGAHINPAVTFAFVLTREFPASNLLFYWSAQILGAITASFILLMLIGDVAQLGATVPSGSAFQSLVMEFILSFILMFVIMSVATDVRSVAGFGALAIGATIALEAIFAGHISGASMNPARSIGPMLIAGVWSNQWIYIFGPILGASAGAFCYQWLRGAEWRKSSN